MSGSLNKVTLIGNLGRDPEIRSTQDGREIANLAIATSESWKDKNTGERKEKTEWHRVAIFNDGLVRVVKNYLKKGSKVYIEGQLQTRKWVDQTGAERYTTEVVLQGYSSSLIMLDGRAGGGAGAEGGYGGQQNYGNQSFGGNAGGSSLGTTKPDAAPSYELDDEIPF